MSDYDIIGDIHGHADALIALLRKLGYHERNGAWRHPERQVLFLGDYIDRGPQQLTTVNIVRRMVEAGSAHAIMGNHEFNAIAWSIPDEERPGDYLRSHERPGERAKHAGFLADVGEGSALHREVIDWFLSLPLLLELPGLRLVHACWHPPVIDYLCPRLDEGFRLSRALMPEAARRPANPADEDNPAVMSLYKAIETVLKGLEVPLPAPHSFRDRDGHERRRVRVRWWDPAADSYRRTAMVKDSLRTQLPETPIPAHALIHVADDKPTFIGHYWLNDARPAPLSQQIACLDYSVAARGKLVAYRWDGEPELSAAKMCWVEE